MFNLSVAKRSVAMEIVKVSVSWFIAWRASSSHITQKSRGDGRFAWGFLPHRIQFARSPVAK
jgi:hypothetical protein